MKNPGGSYEAGVGWLAQLPNRIIRLNITVENKMTLIFEELNIIILLGSPNNGLGFVVSKLLEIILAGLSNILSWSPMVSTKGIRQTYMGEWFRQEAVLVERKY